MRWLRSILKKRTGGRPMAALTAGTKAPDFELKAMDGRRFVLSEELARGPVVLAFFKVSCPVCQYAFPFLERLERAYGHQGVRIIGVSQNDPKKTAAFSKEFGVTFPVLLDDPESYPASNAYGLTNVPTLFWIAQDGEIEVSSVGWVKADFEQVNRKIAEARSIAPASLFKPGEDVRDFRAG
jgi:cytochrome c biogenesis protein CcmG/thiol:disulfide interchange protein DsbE